jgi:osmotically-inducible protein OsmY
MATSPQGNHALPDQEQRAPTQTTTDAVRAMAESQLCHSGYYELHYIACSFHEGVLTLRGCVSSYYLKQLAASLVCQVAGVEEISNRLEVVPPPLP